MQLLWVASTFPVFFIPPQLAICHLELGLLFCSSGNLLHCLIFFIYLFMVCLRWCYFGLSVKYFAFISFVCLQHNGTILIVIIIIQSYMQYLDIKQLLCVQQFIYCWDICDYNIMQGSFIKQQLMLIIIIIQQSTKKQSLYSKTKNMLKKGLFCSSRLYNQYAIIIISLLLLQLSVGRDCTQCQASQINNCKICYQNCNDFHFISCGNQTQNWLQADCISSCCNQYQNYNGHFDQSNINNCIISEETSNQNSLSRIGYFVILVIGCTAMLALFVIIIRQIIRRCRNHHGENPQVAPQMLNATHMNILPHNTTLNSFNSMHAMSNRQEQNRQFPENSDEIVKDQTNTCCICLDSNVNAITKCGHAFHVDCLIAWSSRKNSCPLCNYSNINQAKIYCQQCKVLKKQIDFKYRSFSMAETIKRQKCIVCGK